MRRSNTASDCKIISQPVYQDLLHSLLYCLRYALFKIKRFFKASSIHSPYNVRLTPNWSDTTFRLYCTAAYGFFLYHFIKRINKDFIFIDIGANQGLYSIVAEHNHSCKKIYAFEPIQKTADLLNLNIQLNQCNKITVINKAVSDQTGQASIFYNENHSGSTSMVRAKKASKQIVIDLANHKYLSHTIKNASLPIFVKIDVEGYETIVIKELFKTCFSDKIDILFFEYHENRIDWEDLKSFLEKNNFTSFQMIGGKRHYDILACKDGSHLAKTVKHGSP